LFCFVFILFYFLVDFVFLFLAILFCRAWSTLGENAFCSVPNANYPIPIASRHFKFDQNQMLTKSNSSIVTSSLNRSHPNTSGRPPLGWLMRLWDFYSACAQNVWAV
jgi:hypothetical protein